MTGFATCFWFDNDAEEAARFYVDLFEDAELGEFQRLGIDTPSGKAGDVVTVSFTLNGTPYVLLNGGKQFPQTPAASIMALCDTQAEVDRVWAALLDGGTAIQCGWLTDRFGVTWQVVPKALFALLADPDPGRARRAAEAKVSQIKLDIDAIQAAADAA